MQTRTDIEYRAYFDDLKTILPVDTLSFSAGGIDVSGPGVGQGWAVVNEEYKDKINRTVTLMQYTGFKDVNDTKIFEYDVIKTKSGNVWRVEWKNNQWMCVDTPFEMGLGFYYNMGSVIGFNLEGGTKCHSKS